MSLKFKPYDPTHQKQRARRRQKEPQRRTVTSLDPGSESLSPFAPQPPYSLCIEESDLIPIGAQDGISDPYANFPSPDECLSLCASAANVSDTLTPASAYSPVPQTDSFAQDSATDVEDDGLDSACQSIPSHMVHMTHRPVLTDDDFRQCYTPVSNSVHTASESSRGLCPRSADALDVLISAAIAKQGTAAEVRSVKRSPGPGTEIVPFKRPRTEDDEPEERDAETFRSPKRPNLSDLNSRSPLLGSADSIPTRASPRVDESGSQLNGVPRDSSPQIRPGSHVDLSLVNSGHPASQPAEAASMPAEQAKLVRAELLVIQKMISSLLAKLEHGQAPNTLLDRSTDSGSEGGGDADTRFDAGSTKRKRDRSKRRFRWTDEEEELLRRLKNTGRLSDSAIARKLSRSENGVKQHWCIMLQADSKE